MLGRSDFDAAIVHWLHENTLQGVITTDASLLIRGWNRWMEQTAGRPAESVAGRHLFDLFPELVQRRLDRFYNAALDGQVTVLAQWFHKYLLKFPTEYPLNEMQQAARIAPLLSEGRVVGTITLIEDVTERVVRENELIGARQAADEANDAKDRFLAVLSHDLRTPLAAILGWTGLLQDRCGDEDLVQKGVEIIRRNASVQLELIEQILDMSRIRSAKLELNCQRVDLRELIVSAIETLQPLAERKSIRVTCIMPDEPRTAALDPKRFQQIIWNLVSNAVKFTPQGGWLRVSLVHRERTFQLSVADNGKGIPRSSLARVFEPLWQAEESQGHGGLGLGLAIVRDLVELHGGSIRAESAGPGEGATFIVEMPWDGPTAGQMRQPGAKRNEG